MKYTFHLTSLETKDSPKASNGLYRLIVKNLDLFNFFCKPLTTTIQRRFPVPTIVNLNLPNILAKNLLL